MKTIWSRRPRREPVATLVRAATAARGRPEPPDAETIEERLQSLAAAAADLDDDRFAERLAEAAPALLGYLLSFELDGSPPGFLSTYTGDAFSRFLHTLDLTPRPLTGSVLEIGANPYLFHLLLRAAFPQATVTGSNFFDHDIFSTRIGSARHRLRSERLGRVLDFEFPTFNLETVHPYPFPAGSFDVVYFCETLEHLVVNPLRVFRELRRVLRPGGHLVLTLPNALRWANVGAMLAGRNFFDLYWVGNGVHGRHNREFSLPEVRTLLERDGFEVVRAETRDRFDYDQVPIEAVDYAGPAAPVPFGRAELERWVQKAGGTTTDRGDNIYIVARRPALEKAAGTGVPNLPVPASRPSADERLLSFLDVVEETEEGLLVTGWAFLTDDSSGVPARIDVVLAGGGAASVHPTRRMLRADVSSAHGIEHDEVGFTARIPASALPSSPYEIRVRLGTSSGVTAEGLLRRSGGPSHCGAPR